MVFFGEARWHDHSEEHGAHGDAHEPHESPWMMTLPLVVLAVLSVLGGALQLPFSHSTKFLEHWLAPVVEESERSIAGTWAESNKWLLLVLAVVIAGAGIAASVAVYAKGKAKPVEPKLLADGWRYDASIAALVGGPGRAAFSGVAAFDAKIVDGAVNGIGIEVRTVSGLLRKVQNGFIRSYAAVIGVSVVLMLAWFLLRGVL